MTFLVAAFALTALVLLTTPAQCTVSYDLLAAWRKSCVAHTEAECLVKAGCRWFSYNSYGGCKLCDQWFGDQLTVTGCRDWDSQNFCGQQIFSAATKKWGGDTAGRSFREAVRRYQITEKSYGQGRNGIARSRCDVRCDSSQSDRCAGRPTMIDEVQGVDYGGTAPVQTNCLARTESECHQKAGCHWFSYEPDGGCTLCNDWFGDQLDVTGCRDWSVASYCNTQIFSLARHKWRRDPTDPSFRDAVQHYHISQGHNAAGHPSVTRHRCNIACNETIMHTCSGKAELTSKPPAAWSMNCKASTKDECIRHANCRWFSYDPQGGCKICDKLFGDRQHVTGCRDWTPEKYCQNQIVGHAKQGLSAARTAAPFKAAVRRFYVTEGRGEAQSLRERRLRCGVWCDPSPPHACVGRTEAMDEVKGVNYGGRFIPEKYLDLPGSHDLFAGVMGPASVGGRKAGGPSLCDVAAAPDAAGRVAAFLEMGVKLEHFDKMAASGFNLVRLPLGYWHLMDMRHGETPDAAEGSHFRSLQRIMPASNYTKWIDRVFAFARLSGMVVLMDLHGAPGGQAGGASTGCDQGAGGHHFDSMRNRRLGVNAIEGMARICGRHGDVCYGIELLNEPDESTDRAHLRSFYLDAISVARRHIAHDKAIVIMDWPKQLSWWQNNGRFSYAQHGNIMFSTHIKGARGIESQGETRQALAADISKVSDFYRSSGYDIVVSEYTLSGHGTGYPKKDPFDYNSLASWLVHQFNHHGIGSVVWNFDAAPWVRSWGPVALSAVGAHPIDWKEINAPRHRLIAQRVRPLGGGGSRRPSGVFYGPAGNEISGVGGGGTAVLLARVAVAVALLATVTLAVLAVLWVHFFYGWVRAQALCRDSCRAAASRLALKMGDASDECSASPMLASKADDGEAPAGNIPAKGGRGARKGPAAAVGAGQGRPKNAVPETGRAAMKRPSWAARPSWVSRPSWAPDTSRAARPSSPSWAPDTSRAARPSRPSWAPDTSRAARPSRPSWVADTSRAARPSRPSWVAETSRAARPSGAGGPSRELSEEEGSQPDQ